MRLCRTAILPAVIALTACATTEVETYQRVQSARVDQAYIKPGVNFSRYTKLYAYPLEIYYADGAGAPTPEDLQRMRNIFRNAFLAEIGGYYEVVRKPAKDALGVRASLVDLRSSKVYGEIPLQGRLRDQVRNGQLTFLLELSDSVSGEVLARAADSEKEDDPEFAAGETDWRAAGRAARRWAYFFRTFLDENLGKE